MPPSHKGKKRSNETKFKQSESLKDYYKKHPERAEKQSKHMKEFFKTEEGKAFQRKSIETKKSEDFRKQQSIKCKKANRTPEYVARQSKIAKETWKSKEYIEAHSGANNCRAQAVRQYDLNRNLIAEYPTMTEAYKTTGVDFRKISLVAKGKRKTAGGYIWEYVNEKKFKPFKSSFVYDVNKDKSAIPIIQYDLEGKQIAEYNSTAEAARANGFPNRNNITHNLKGKTKHAYGYIWKYKSSEK